MTKNNIGVNAILNLVRAGLSILFPLITYPYALRVIGVNNIGAVSYVTSIISYFSLFAMLGASTYAVREGAKIRDDKKKITEFASQVFTINVICTMIAYGILSMVLFGISRFSSYKDLFIILSLNIVFTVLAVDWMNTIYEDFLYITIRSIAINILSLIALFVFVKTEDDYLVYACMQVLTHGLICISNWFYCRRYVKLRLVKHIHLKQHLPKMLVLFVNALAISIYVNLDTTMLGWIRGEHEVGLYSASTRIYGVVKSLMIAVYSVSIPRLAALHGKKDGKGYMNLFTSIWTSVSLILIPACIGLALLAEEFIAIIGGEAYADAALSLVILAVALLFAIFGGLITSCLNVTIGREKENLISTLLSAVINCVLNFIVIPLWGLNGAAVTTLVAEAFVVIFCFTRIPNKELYFDRNAIFLSMLHASIGSIGIVGVCLLSQVFIHGLILRTLIALLLSCVVYVVALLVLKDKILLSLVNNLKEKTLRKTQ